MSEIEAHHLVPQSATMITLSSVRTAIVVDEIGVPHLTAVWILGTPPSVGKYNILGTDLS